MSEIGTRLSTVSGSRHETARQLGPGLAQTPSTLHLRGVSKTRAVHCDPGGVLRPSPPSPVSAPCMIEEIRERLSKEVQQLNHELHVVLPEVLQKARELGDLRENADFQAAIERQQFIQARLSHLRDRLGRLSSIDTNKIPRDRVGLGSIVTVLDLETQDREVFELVIPDAMDVDAGHISVSSPLGQALLGLQQGEEAGVQLPFGTRRLKIERIQTIHVQLENNRAGSAPAEVKKPSKGKTSKGKRKKAKKKKD